jgi:hypothetical protein
MGSAVMPDDALGLSDLIARLKVSQPTMPVPQHKLSAGGASRHGFPAREVVSDRAADPSASCPRSAGDRVAKRRPTLAALPR